jgi:hypothetical protein
LGTTNTFIGPGHAEVFQVGDEDCLSGHYYDGQDRGRPKLFWRRFRWTADGWPVVAEPEATKPESPARVGGSER